MGGVARVNEPPADDAVQVKVTPAVSAAIVVGPQPAELVTSDSGSVTVQFTATSETYQPFVPSVPEIECSISGGVKALAKNVTAPSNFVGTPSITIGSTASDRRPVVGTTVEAKSKPVSELTRSSFV